MGGAFSCGEDNDDLVNILKLHRYISSKNVERVFRAVDRGHYILPSHYDLAYKDMSFKVGYIHLSAPCVYCKVMEGLSLQSGLSFLNIGSGTGYLSTMAGLILGENGTNHGIEMHEDCVDYAYQLLKDFKQKFLDVDVFEFCEPVFQLGNFLNAMPTRQYDRVYCGAACPEAHEKFVKQFVKIGGILVMPYKDHLLRIKRNGPDSWNHDALLPVSFASLMTPQEEADRCLLQLPICKPHTLQELCRSSIRRHLRKIVWSEHYDLEESTLIKTVPVEHPLSGSRSGFGIPLIDRGNQGRGEVISSTLELLMESSLQAVFTGVGGENDTSGGSDDNDEFVVDRLLVHPANGDRRIFHEETENAETGAHDDSWETMDEDEHKNVSMDVAMEENHESTKETNDVEMRESKESEQGGSEFARSSGSSMKRKNPERESDDSSNESDRNIRPRESNDQNEGNPSADMSDSDDEDNLDFVLFKKVYSMLKVKSEMDENSESSSNEAENNKDWLGETSTLKSSSKNSEALRSEESGGIDELSYENGVDESLFPRKLDSPMNQQRGSRKRERSCESKSDDQRPDIKVPNADGKGPRSAGKNDEKSLDEKCEISDHGDENNQDLSDSSSEEESDDSSSSGDTSDSLHDADSDDGDVTYLSRPVTKPTFAHTIRKDLFSGFMRKKIDQLPLPRPLRLYVNYNREL